MNRHNDSLGQPLQRVIKVSRWGSWWWYIAAMVSALALPVLIVLIGLVAKLLEQGRLEQDSVALGHYLSIPLPNRFESMPAGRQLLWLVGAGYGVAAIYAGSLLIFFRGLLGRVRGLVQRLHEMVLITSVQVAAGEGISAQRKRTTDLLELHLPRVQRALVMHWRVWPRNITIFFVCTVLAFLVDTWLTLLAIISGLLIWQLYRTLESRVDGEGVQMEVASLRRRLIEMVQTVPVISRVRGDDALVIESATPLARLMEFHLQRDLRKSRTTPLVMLAIATAVALLLLVLGASVLANGSTLGLSGAIVLILALLAAVTSATRILRLLAGIGDATEACEAVWSFVDRAATDKSGELIGLSGKRHVVRFSEVSFSDGSGRQLLERISLQFEPGSIVALLGTDTSAVSSLVELMMGFGTPRAGRVTIDDVGLDQLHDRWLKREVLWVGQSGPIWAGSVLENMSSIDSPVDSGAALEVAKKIGIVDKLQSLPEGLQTILDADDSRLDPAAKYGLALARARLRQPSIVIAQEPPNYNHNGLLGDDPGLEVLTELARLGTLVVLLPQRLQSLRAADRVVLLHQGRFAGEGKHEELLATSDLYRHLNYLLFNPFRQRV